MRRRREKCHTSTSKCLAYDDTIPLSPPNEPGRPHVKTVFPEYELEDFGLQNSGSDTIQFSEALNGNLDGFVAKVDDDIWSAISFTSTQTKPFKQSPRKTGKGKPELTDDIITTPRLTLQKIEKCGSIAKKQKQRKQTSAIPTQTKQLLTSVKNIFRYKSAKSDHTAKNGAAARDEREKSLERSMGDGGKGETPVQAKHDVSDVGSKGFSGLNTPSRNGNAKSTVPGFSESLDVESKELRPERIVGYTVPDTRQDDGVVGKRVDMGDALYLPRKTKKDTRNESGTKSGIMAVLKTTISLRREVLCDDLAKGNHEKTESD